MTSDQATKLVEVLDSAYPYKRKPETLRLYAAKLSAFPYDVVHDTIDAIIEHEEKWPALAVVIKAANRRIKAANRRRDESSELPPFNPDIARQMRKYMRTIVHAHDRSARMTGSKVEDESAS